jgi:DNA invertase Pin-like site-specific DNA recombinase
MERPALKRLLTEIGAGKIDIVVVYKVDRLTRALSDFAKIVEIFDARGMSFVSVTQQFNTTSSMGRLTLNVLLSFAQFEREVTGERIRDKIAASKKKGMWMGGFVPLGYDARDRKLIVNPGEAEIVRRIFHRYAEIGNIDLIQAELDAEGIRTKERTGKAKARWGERPFTKNGLYRMLQNRIYIGQITHKENSYRGEHKAIIDQDLWDRVQQRLNGNRIQRRNGASAKEASLLAGLLYDEQGRRLTPSHATKGSRRYRYYVTPTDPLATSSPNQRAWRLPANEIEELVRLEIIGLLQSTTRLGHVLDLRSATPEDRPGSIRPRQRGRELSRTQASTWSADFWSRSSSASRCEMTPSISRSIHPGSKRRFCERTQRAQPSQKPSTMRSTSCLIAFELTPA